MSQSTSELRVVYDFSTQFLRFLDGRELGYRSLSCEISPSQVHRKTRRAWVNVFLETPRSLGNARIISSRLSPIFLEVYVDSS
jgi:hypothetical protein